MVPESRTVGSRLRPRVTQTVGVPRPIGPGWSSEDVSAGLPSSSSYREIYYIKGELPDGRWLRYALPVVVHVEQGEYVASQPQLDLFAFGSDAIEAIYGLRDEIVVAHDRLEELGGALSPRLVRQRDLLRKLLDTGDA